MLELGPNSIEEGSTSPASHWSEKAPDIRTMSECFACFHLRFHLHFSRVEVREGWVGPPSDAVWKWSQYITCIIEASDKLCIRLWICITSSTLSPHLRFVRIFHSHNKVRRLDYHLTAVSCHVLRFRAWLEYKAFIVLPLSLLSTPPLSLLPHRRSTLLIQRQVSH